MAHPSVVINGVTYSNCPEVDIPKSGGGTAKFYDTSEANITQGDVLTGKKGYGSSGEVSGSMANNGDTSGTISTKDGVVSIPSGYTSGGTVAISNAEKSNLDSMNIVDGKTILGVSGYGMNKNTVITPIGTEATSARILSGYKAWANGNLVTGSLTVPTISQDGTTKVLTIS